MVIMITYEHHVAIHRNTGIRSRTFAELLLLVLVGSDGDTTFIVVGVRVGVDGEGLSIGTDDGFMIVVGVPTLLLLLPLLGLFVVVVVVEGGDMIGAVLQFVVEQSMKDMVAI
jgi:hypothetical protein